jgi:acetyltransferase-like isoleucine patch superfamily enzyme
MLRLERILHGLAHRWWYARSRVLYGIRLKEMGTGTTIRRPLMLRGLAGVSLGSEVHIRDGARIELRQRPGEKFPSLEIGHNVFIEQDLHLVCCGTIRIGSYVSIAARCAIVDVDHPVHDLGAPHNLGSAISAGETWVDIGAGAFLGVGVVVLPRTRIGEGAVVGAGSVVTRDVPPWSIVAGAPASVIGSRARPTSWSNGVTLSAERN